MISKKKYIVFAVIAMLFIGLFFRHARRAPKRNFCDFRVYYATGQRFVQKKDIYDRPDEAIGPFKYSPMFALLCAPLSFVSKGAASLIFFTINFILLLFIFIFSKKLIVRDKISYRQNVFLYVLPLICTFRFILQVLDSGQVGIVILSLVVSGLYFLQKNKDKLAGAFIGMSTMFKYTSFVFLPYFFLKNKKKLFSYIVIFILLFCLFPAIYTGITQHYHQLQKWLPSIVSTSLDKGSWYDHKNQSFYSLILRFLGKDSPYKIPIANLTFNQALSVGIILAMIMYSLIVFTKSKGNFAKRIDYSLLFICTAIFNPNAWMHNFVILIFVYMTLFYYLLKVNFKDKVTLTLLILSFVLAGFPGQSIVGNSLEEAFEKLSSVTIGALLLAFSLFRLKFKKCQS